MSDRRNGSNPTQRRRVKIQELKDSDAMYMGMFM